MLHITASTKTLKEELRIGNGLIKDIMVVLGDEKCQKNLTKHVGHFVTDMPEFKVLTKDAEAAKQLLRKVCTGEITPMDAYWRFADAQKEILFLQNALDSLVF